MAEVRKSYNYQGLDDADVAKAKKELNEDPSKVVAQIASLRHWAERMRHLTCRTDDVFLLRFLRAAKFEQSRAQQLLDNFCTVRASTRGSPNWFKPMPFDSQSMQAFMKLPLTLKLGQNDNGELVIYSSTVGFGPDLMPLEDFIRCSYMKMDWLLSSERAVIHGCRIISDLKGSSRKQFEMFNSPKMMFQMMRNMQDALPLRMKAIIYFNEPTYMDIMLGLCLPVMKEKLKKRIHRCGSDIHKLKKAIGPGADRLLPQDLGGSNKTVAELLDENKAAFTNEEAESERQLLTEIRVDESKRESDTKNYLKTYENATDPSMGIAGTFTKLNVD